MSKLYLTGLTLLNFVWNWSKLDQRPEFPTIVSSISNWFKLVKTWSNWYKLVEFCMIFNLDLDQSQRSVQIWTTSKWSTFAGAVLTNRSHDLSQDAQDRTILSEKKVSFCELFTHLSLFFSAWDKSHDPKVKWSLF